MKYHRSEVCLEPGFLDQIYFMKDLWKMVKSYLPKTSNSTLSSKNTPKELAENLSSNNCDGSFFKRIKLAEHKPLTVIFSDHYDAALLSDHPGVVLLEVELSQDNLKDISVRSSTQILDYLGDTGGFLGSVIVIFYLFGEYFSSRYFIDQVGRDMYVKKLNTNEIKSKSDHFEGG